MNKPMEYQHWRDALRALRKLVRQYKDGTYNDLLCPLCSIMTQIYPGRRMRWPMLCYFCPYTILALKGLLKHTLKKERWNDTMLLCGRIIWNNPDTPEGNQRPKTNKSKVARVKWLEEIVIPAWKTLRPTKG